MARLTKMQQANKAFNIFNTEEVKPINEPKKNGIWINIGMYAMVSDEDGLNEREEFINLPINISLDMIQNSANYKYLMSGKQLSPLSIKKKKLIEAIEAQCASLNENNCTYLSKLQVQIYKEFPQKELEIFRDKKIFSETNSILIKKNKLSSIIPKDKNKIEIQNIINQRKIPHLVHFTNLKNLESILKNGLVPRLILENRNLSFKFNDDLRLEQCKEANCLSVSFPNYKMFYTCKSKNRSEKWVVLLIDPLILLEKEALFFRTNAAHSSSTSWLNKNKNYLMTAKAFECMFDSERKNLLDYYPTDAQAEILLLDVIEPHFIQSLVFQETTILHSDDIEFLKNLNINIMYDDRFFKKRDELEHLDNKDFLEHF